MLYSDYAEFGVVTVPAILDDFVARTDVLGDAGLADRLATDPRTGPLQARLREIYASAPHLGATT